jgi:hypothetical protein
MTVAGAVAVANANLGVCNKCRRRVPVGHEVREGRAYIVKDCPDCGRTEALVSSDAVRWQAKRDLCRFDPKVPTNCRLDCAACGRKHHPRMVFLDVTNRCNMNCPICIANIPGMGFEFHPPLSYFRKVLAGLAKMDPKPLVQLFGGEPTVRKDLLEIIGMARGLGLDVRVVTNGLKLADEDYCRELCESRVHVLMAFDGRDPAIYTRLRKNPGAYEKKLKALENLQKYSRHKNTLMCCVARNVNDRHMRDLIDFCHERRGFIKCLHLIPLTETWEEGTFEQDVVATTTEDVEQIIAEAFPGEPVEFLPAGLTEHLQPAAKFFGGVRLKFGGVHPNCESATYLVSDGRRYRPVGSYLKRSVDEIAAGLVERSLKLNPRLSRLDPGKPLQRFWGRALIVRTHAGLLLGSLDARKIFQGNPAMALLRILGGALAGRRLKVQLRKHTNLQSVMLMVVLPFEEYHSIESARLQNCFSGFAYEDPDTGEIKTVPVCIWGLYKNEVQRKIAARYRGAAQEAASQV